MLGFLPSAPATSAVVDPRHDPAPLSQVPALLAAGAAAYNEGRFWDAHEAWEESWHALRGAHDDEAAGYVRGLILVTAAFENAKRGKEAGFKRQMAEGLHALWTHSAAAERLGIANSAAWPTAVAAVYVDACRRRRWTWWQTSAWQAPPLALTP